VTDFVFHLRFEFQFVTLVAHCKIIDLADDDHIARGHFLGAKP
jgi:hypothetical protein